MIDDADKQILKAAKEIILRETADTSSKLLIVGLGSFERRKMNARTATNMQTGAKIAVPAKSALRFKASKTTDGVV